MNMREWFTIQMSDAGVADLYIYDFIDSLFGKSAADFQAELDLVRRMGTEDFANAAKADDETSATDHAKEAAE